MRIAPKPSRRTGSAPPMAKVPLGSAEGAPPAIVVMCRRSL
jgi:hypothetical protein